MDRMSPLDASFIHIEDANNPMHIGSVVVFEGPAPAYGDLVRQVASKLPLVPRYRQKVREVPFQLGRPVWIDDPHFTTLYHIRRTGLPAVARTPLASLSYVQDILGGTLSQAMRLARPGAPGLNGPIGPHRRWSWARGSLADVKEIREAFGGTVNDVVLAVITRGFGDL